MSGPLRTSSGLGTCDPAESATPDVECSVILEPPEHGCCNLETAVPNVIEAAVDDDDVYSDEEPGLNLPVESDSEDELR